MSAFLNKTKKYCFRVYFSNAGSKVQKDFTTLSDAGGSIIINLKRSITRLIFLLYSSYITDPVLMPQLHIGAINLKFELRGPNYIFGSSKTNYFKTDDI